MPGIISILFFFSNKKNYLCTSKIQRYISMLSKTPSMISKARIKWIKSLEIRKYRQQYKAFVAEGPKLVEELLPYSTPLCIVATQDWLNQNEQIKAAEIYAVSQEELKRISLLRTPQNVLTVMPIPDRKLDLSALQGRLVIALDGVQDPGNIGTILRTADWFGIKHVLCSEGTVDVYNPKCVQSCMGALARVEVYYCHLPEVLSKVQMPIYGTFLDGKDIYAEELHAEGIIVMGNEGNGISAQIAEMINRRLYVPNFPKGSLTTESLNVAVTTGIVCAEFRRRLQS